MADKDKLYQQAILNIIWSRQFLSAADFQRIADALATGNELPTRPIDETTTLLNPPLNGLGFEIRKGTSESDGTHFYALCNLKADAGSKLATHFKPVELLYFRSVIKAIMTAKPSGCATFTDVYNARLEESPMKPISVEEAKHLIARLVEEHWLSIPEPGYLSVGPRCLLELRQYIEGEYSDNITECTVCSDIVVRGESCMNAVCTVKLHHHCARTWFHGKARKCPACTNAWPAAPAGWEDNEPLPAPRQFHPGAIEL